MTEIERIKKEGWLSNDFWASETICDYFVSEEKKKVWAILLDLYKEFQRVCEKHHLQYWANSGTALGAVRHGGFIPWDDDMDFHMLREDYDKLITLADEFKEPYFLQHQSTDPEYGFSIIRIRNSNTYATADKYSYANFNMGMYIDIMPLDNVESIDDVNTRSKKIVELYMHNSARMLKNNPQKNEKDLETIRKYYNHDITPLMVISEIDKIAKEKADKKTQFLCQLVLLHPYAAKNQMWRRNLFNDYVTTNFYGLKMRLPIDTEEYLKVHFGDWEKFPPVEKRGIWHPFEFYPDIPYRRYLKDIQKK